MAKQAAKYVLLPTYYGIVAWAPKGKIELSKDTSQTNLKYLHELNHQGVRKVGDDPVADEQSSEEPAK